MIILDLGSGSTCRNEKRVVKKMIDSIADVDSRRKCYLKFQLWSKGSEPQCVKLNWALFKWAFVYAEGLGFRTTASVFDKAALDYLLTFDVPFVKIANRPYLRPLQRYIPRGIPVVRSVYDFMPQIHTGFVYGDVYEMACVTNYPATTEEYEDHFKAHLEVGISDHTIGLDLWRKYKPDIYERHFRLPDSTGPDAGAWAATPDDLREILA